MPLRSVDVREKKLLSEGYWDRLERGITPNIVGTMAAGSHPCPRPEPLASPREHYEFSGWTVRDAQVWHRLARMAPSRLVETPLQNGCSVDICHRGNMETRSRDDAKELRLGKIMSPQLATVRHLTHPAKAPHAGLYPCH